jgi:hypothetical protein
MRSDEGRNHQVINMIINADVSRRDCRDDRRVGHRGVLAEPVATERGRNSDHGNGKQLPKARKHRV